jgi:hypothetical protein
MNDPVLVIGILFVAAGAILLALTYLYPESARRENRRIRNLALRARDAGLRGRYKFDHDRSGSGATGGHGTFEPADSEDRALFANVGSRIEGESAFFASEMLWTDERLAWVGIPLLVIGLATCAVSVFG